MPLAGQVRHVTDPAVLGSEFDPKKHRQEIKVSDRYLLMESVSLTDKWGQPGYLVIGRDVTESKRLMERLENLSVTDPLTGLYNRRQLIARLEEETERAEKLGGDFLVFMVDIRVIAE